MLTVLFFFLLLVRHIPIIQQWLITCFILVTLINCGAIMEQKMWVAYLEFIRLVLVLLCIVVICPVGWLMLSLAGIVYLAWYYFKELQLQYLKLVYAHSPAH